MKNIMFFVLVAMFVATGCTTRRIVATSGGRVVASQDRERVVYLPQPRESALVEQARAMGDKMARYKESRHRACVELRRADPYADCVRALGPIEMTCSIGYGGGFSCNPPY